jgi:hypothetical protein
MEGDLVQRWRRRLDEPLAGRFAADGGGAAS